MSHINTGLDGILYRYRSGQYHGLLDLLFDLRGNNTSVKTEIIAGITTFISMAYILFVIPSMLKQTGIPEGAAVAACIWSTALCTIAMGVFANFPVAVAPGMGLTAFFTFYVCGTEGLPWQTALGAVFISGIVFLILTISRIRQMIIRSVPESLKSAIVVGIGMFIAFIGLSSAGIVVASPATKVTLGNLSSAPVLLSCIGVLLIGGLMALKINGSILIGILAVAALSMILGVSPTPHQLSDVFAITMPGFSETFMAFDLMGALRYGLVSIVFTFTIVELFDNIGTLIGVARAANMVHENGRIKNLGRALMTDSVGTMVSAVMGTCTVTTYIESATGVNSGGRTGLTAVVIGILFLLCFFITPLAGLIPACATAPALIIVGAMMTTNISRIDFSDFSEALPAFLTIIIMPMTYSIANGFAFGFTSYCFLKLVSGRFKEVTPFMMIITVFLCISLIN